MVDFSMIYSQFLGWINVLLVGSYLVSRGSTIKCYVCGGEETESFPCSEFHVWDSRYNKICEQNSQSCRIVQGVEENKVISRSCEIIKLDDCKIANGIKFCYCSNDLCNKLGSLDENKEFEDTDEEFADDSREGSGSKNVYQKISTQEPDILVDVSSTTEKSPIYLDKDIETNIIPTDQKYSSSGFNLRSNLYWPSSILLLMYLIFAKQY